MTIEQPLANGYYNIATAIRALETADIDDDAKLGMIITFEVSAGKWVDYRFCGSSIDNFLIPASWEEYGGGKIKQISVNGQNVTPDADGKVKEVYIDLIVTCFSNSECFIRIIKYWIENDFFLLNKLQEMFQRVKKTEKLIACMVFLYNI